MKYIKPHKNTSKYVKRLDGNIELSESTGSTAEYLDVKLGNRRGVLITEVFHKPSHRPYSLPFTSTHAQRIKKNNPYVALTRAIRYSSNFDAYKREEVHIYYGTIVTDDGETPVINDTISCIDFHVNYCGPYPVLYLF
ncbi:unnamed protein product [Adineta steineri]|uniref:Helix-turn-helix domain-containing protein n=1 Tax=Adineta steineri TaxID=433720 RepID=A0A819GXV4_9BILA|nr:unnamed protein product [Adineta steineri]